MILLLHDDPAALLACVFLGGVVIALSLPRHTKEVPAMKLSAIRSETKKMTIHFDHGDLNVTYRPHTFTADMADQVNAALRDPKKQTIAMFEMIGETLVDWDLEADDGLIIPVDDAARLRAEVPMQVFGRIFVEIQNDQSTAGAGKSAT